MRRPQHVCDITVSLSTPLSQGEYDFLLCELDEWLFDHFTHWPTNPFGDFSLNCHVLRRSTLPRANSP